MSQIEYSILYTASCRLDEFAPKRLWLMPKLGFVYCGGWIPVELGGGCLVIAGTGLLVSRSMCEEL